MSTHPLLKNLTLEERDLIRETLQSDVFPVFCKILKELSNDYRESVLNYSLQDMTDSSLGEFALLKARQQGVDSLVLKVSALKTTIK
jgi:hypothetical protein